MRLPFTEMGKVVKGECWVGGNQEFGCGHAGFDVLDIKVLSRQLHI